MVNFKSQFYFYLKLYSGTSVSLFCFKCNNLSYFVMLEASQYNIRKRMKTFKLRSFQDDKLCGYFSEC